MIVRSPYLILRSLYLTQSVPNFKELFFFSSLWLFLLSNVFSCSKKIKSQKHSNIKCKNSSNIKTTFCLVSRNWCPVILALFPEPWNALIQSLKIVLNSVNFISSGSSVISKKTSFSFLLCSYSVDRQHFWGKCTRGWWFSSYSRAILSDQREPLGSSCLSLQH